MNGGTSLHAWRFNGPAGNATEGWPIEGGWDCWAPAVELNSTNATKGPVVIDVDASQENPPDNLSMFASKIST
jgi:hypothetical protein